jgi:hypothetical protein
MAFQRRSLRVLIPVVFLAFAVACAERSATTTPIAPRLAASASVVRAAPQCDPTLWDHVYAGDPARFATPKDRLQIVQECITVTGTIQAARVEKDGDFHVTVKVDAAFKSLLNAENISGQHGFLVVEPVCQNKVTQPDTVKERVCAGFHQTVFMKRMIGKHVEITGAYVTDMEHGWREIHPVTSIIVK